MDTARLLFETLLADLSSQFINVDARLVDTAIDEALKHVGELLDVDAGALTQLADRDRALVFTHYWSRTGDVPPYLKVDAGHVMPFGLARLMAGDVHCFSSINELPPDVPDRAYLAKMDVKSAIT